MSYICKHYIISGKVQGVFFRKNTQYQATILNITGWVKNLPTGQVEVIACGTAEQLTKLSNWLQQGPALAHVTTVIESHYPITPYQQFTISS